MDIKDKLAKKLNKALPTPVDDEVEMVSQDLELEDLIDEEIEDLEVEEEILKELEKEEMQVSNNQLYKSLLDINESIITSKREELIVDNKIFRAIEKGNDVISKVDSKFNKLLYAYMTGLFILGLLLGMQDDTWLPYVSNILDFARTATNVVKWDSWSR